VDFLTGILVVTSESEFTSTEKVDLQENTSSIPVERRKDSTIISAKKTLVFSCFRNSFEKNAQLKLKRIFISHY
jgi:hypothetical protein